MANTTLQKHYLRLIRLWPRDALRPVQLQDSLQRRIASRLLPAAQRQQALSTPSVSPPQSPTQGNWIDAKADAAPAEEKMDIVSGRSAKGWSEERELRQVNALYSLLENRYSNAYPISERLLSPEFNPTYYQDLAREMEAAPQRTWLQNKMLRLSRLIRFS